MISFLLGRPGSGKTYYAVDRIFNNFSDDKEALRDTKVTFKNCYTNINEFEFDKLENVYRLDFDKLYEILKRLHAHYKAKKTDKYLVKYLTRLKLKDTLFVIDECHNIFDKKDIVLVWWLSYHRHLFHEIILITPNLALVEAKYKTFSEFFYDARPQSLTLDKRYFYYSVYCSSRMSVNSKSGVIKIKRNKKVFDLYKSGDSINAKNVVLKFLIISFVLAVFFALGFYYFIISSVPEPLPIDIKKVSSNVSNQNKTSKNFVDSTASNIQNISSDYTNLKSLKLSCSTFNCSAKGLDIPPQLVKVYLDSKDFKLLYVQSISKTLDVYYLQMSSDFYNYLIPNQTQGYVNENNTSFTSSSIF